MIDLGDSYTWAVFVNDGATPPSGVTPSSIVLTVTAPDGTTTTPTPTAGTTGNYTAVFVPPIPGRYVGRWVSSGPTAVIVDTIDVAPADPRFLISLADAREQLNVTPTDTVRDEQLRLYVAAVTTVVEELMGPQTPQTVVFTTSGGPNGRNAVMLPTPPVAVTQVTEMGVVLNAGIDYTVDLSAGIVYRGSTWQPYIFLAGQDNITVTYTTGTNIVAANVQLAARIILGHLWSADQQGLGQPGAYTVDTTVIAGYAIPNRAKELLVGTPREFAGFA